MRRSAKSVFGMVALAALAIGAGAAANEAVTLGGQTVPGFKTTAIPIAAFQKLHAAVTSAPKSERWTEIPWQSDLAEARTKAARENKPLFLWIMDGHPLGCT